MRDGYLVPPRPVSVPLKFQREGIKYDDLTEEEKEEWDEMDWDEDGEIPDEVDAAAVNKWLFNEDTVDKVLQHLMTRGLKVDGGDRLGKTIVFAKNHQHAVFIQERFDKNYPHLKGSFARVIDNYETVRAEPSRRLLHARQSARTSPSRWTCSTPASTCPKWSNLVFFKIVRSKTKFWQMIGRGTRLCPDLFGPGRTRSSSTSSTTARTWSSSARTPRGVEGSAQDSISKKLFLRRLELLQTLRQEQRRHGCATRYDARDASRRMARSTRSLPTVCTRKWPP